MHFSEPVATAVFLSAAGLLLATGVLSTRAAGKIGAPVTLLFMAIGMVAGAQGLGRIAFDDYRLTFRLGTVALVLILFDGGFNTPLTAVRAGFRPAALLATVGVVATAGLAALAAHAFGLAWPVALLLGAIISSTDASAVFSVLRLSGVRLKHRVSATLELESGLNDPVAVILTTALTQVLLSKEPVGVGIVWHAFLEIAVGASLGVLFGLAGRLVLKKVPLPAGGLYPVLTVALALLAFGVPTVVSGSGFLAVYITGVLLGSERIRYRAGLTRVHDAVAWLAQICMFLLLGLLVFPSQLVGEMPKGLGIALVLTCVARPLAVWLCLLPFRFPARESLYVGWVGLRGAVPIVLATVPVLAGAPGANALFNLVFFIVLVNAVIPGMTVGWLTRRLGLETNAPPPPSAVLEISSTRLFQKDVRSYYVTPAASVCGAILADLPLTDSATVMMVVRGDDLIAPKGNTELLAGDHVYFFSSPEDVPWLTLLFGQEEVE